MTKFQTRFVSAVVMFPPVVCLVYLGGYSFAALLAVTFVISVYEWVRMALRTRHAYVLCALGLLYLAGSYYLFYLLREMQHIGLTMTVLAFFSVWASDSFAYIFGKILKGPKLLPKVSPNKTIAGLMGAVFGPVLILSVGKGLLDYFEIHEPDMSYMFIISLGCVIGVIAQAGDLLISAFKRAANVKDSGNIIPGHGGLLDRIDALLLAAPAFYLATITFLVT